MSATARVCDARQLVRKRGAIIRARRRARRPFPSPPTRSIQPHMRADQHEGELAGEKLVIGEPRPGRSEAEKGSKEAPRGGRIRRQRVGEEEGEAGAERERPESCHSGRAKVCPTRPRPPGAEIWFAAQPFGQGIDRARDQRKG